MTIFLDVVGAALVWIVVWLLVSLVLILTLIGIERIRSYLVALGSKSERKNNKLPRNKRFN